MSRSECGRRWLAAAALLLAAIGAQAGNLALTAAFAPDGRLWRLYERDGMIQLDHSADLGRSFAAPVTLGAPDRHPALSVEERPAITFAAGQMHLAWPVAAAGRGTSLLLHTSSADGGKSFAEPRPLAAVPGRLHRFAADARGRIHHLWYRDAGTGIADLYLASAGAAPRKLAGDLCDCCRPALVLDADHHPVIAARFVFPGNIRDHGLLHPTEAGAATPLRATFDHWQVAVCPIQGPALAIGAAGRYHLAWFTLGERRGLFHAHSDDRGRHFSTPLAFGDPAAYAMNPRVAASGQEVTLAWQEFRDRRVRILVRQSQDGGANWSTARELASTAGAADRAELLVGPAGSFVSWNTAAEGYRLLAITGD